MSSVDGLADALNNKVTAVDDFSLVSPDERDKWNGKSDFSGSYEDLTGKPTIPSTEGFIKNEAGAFDYENLNAPPDIPVIPDVSTTTTDGLMSSEDKIKLDSINNMASISQTEANIVINPTNMMTDVEYTGTATAVTFSSETDKHFNDNEPCICFAVKNSASATITITIPTIFDGVTLVDVNGILSVDIEAGSIKEFNLLKTCDSVRLLVL